MMGRISCSALKNLICHKKTDWQIGHIVATLDNVIMWWPYHGRGMELLHEDDLVFTEPAEYFVEYR